MKTFFAIIGAVWMFVFLGMVFSVIIGAIMEWGDNLGEM